MFYSLVKWIFIKTKNKFFFKNFMHRYAFLNFSKKLNMDMIVLYGNFGEAEVLFWKFC